MSRSRNGVPLAPLPEAIGRLTSDQRVVLLSLAHALRVRSESFGVGSCATWLASQDDWTLAAHRAKAESDVRKAATGAALKVLARPRRERKGELPGHNNRSKED